MQKRTLKVAILAVLTVVLVLAIALPVFADSTWSDLPDTVTAKYGVTDNQVAAISEGFPNGLWKPYQAVTRAQFTKMAVAAFNIPLTDPATASFTDVPKGSLYYQYIEGAKAAGIANGTSATTFSPNANITRQQAIAIVARYVAQVNGYDLATMYTSDEIDHLLAHFGDAASISTDLRAEVAFAFDMGLTNGDDYGNVNPLANMTRIQGAVFLIRAEALVPPAHWTPAKIELVSTDKTEGLIGQAYKATFQVTTADGHPAIGVLVDFDTLEADWYVGNDSPAAALTNSDGQVTITMLSTEPGVQRVSASVVGLGTIYTTRYWLALDEVYNVDGSTSQNNAGVEHQWGVRVVVFGPGPRSTSVSDWYNAIKTAYVPGDPQYSAGLTYAFDPNNINTWDGIDADNYGLASWDNNDTDNWSLKTEQKLATYGFAPRTLAGIDVKWAIVNKLDNPLTSLINEAETSVGNITKVDGAAITPAKTATGKTDATGLSTITIYSEQVGHTYTQAIADYAGNPYPQELFNHYTFENGDWWHNYDWDDQPTDNATQTKTWIAHTIGGDAGPITLAYQEANIGEEKTLTLTLKDSYGNPVAGKEVEWFMQGVGFFNTDDAGDISDQLGPDSEDYDVTDINGQCTVFAKSYHPGEQIVHAKVRDKGTGGSEGTYLTYTAEIQWFDVDVVTFDNIATTAAYVDVLPSTTPGVEDTYAWVPVDEAVSTNPVGGTHTFTEWVYGLKLELDPTLSDPAHQTPWIDSDAAGSSYDGILDSKDADYFNGVLLVNAEEMNREFGIRFCGYNVADTQAQADAASYHCYVVKLDAGGKIVKGWGTPPTVMAQGKKLSLSLLGGYTMFDVDRDGNLDPFTGQTGIYLPLAGKTVTFSIVNSLVDLYGDDLGPTTPTVASVGSITAPTAPVQTAADGTAQVTVTSNAKGPETIKGSVTWAGNPNAPMAAYAKKVWEAGTTLGASDLKFIVKINGTQVANNSGEIAPITVPAYTDSTTALESYDSNYPFLDNYLGQVHVEVHVQDAYGNDLPDYEVVYLLNSIGSVTDKGTVVPLAYLLDDDTSNTLKNALGVPTNYDTNGTRPDANEPMPSSDPYAYIVGPGYTGGGGPSTWAHRAFFFNQWLGTTPEGTFYPNSTLGAGQPGIPQWPDNRTYGSDIDEYYMSYGDFATIQSVLGDPWDEWNVDAMTDGEGDVALATDGAKAWTLDGWYAPVVNNGGDIDSAQLGSIMPNLLTGSNLDIQLAQDVSASDLNESILRVMIYAPGDGVIKEGSYLYSTQVHVIWDVPHVASITLTPAAAVNADYDHQIQAVVLDQFGNPAANVQLYMWGQPTEGATPYGDTYKSEWLNDPALPAVTDANGVTSITGQAIDWSNWNILALANPDGDTSPALTGGPYANLGTLLAAMPSDVVMSNTVTKYWAYSADMELNDAMTKLTVDADANLAGLSGKTFNVYVDNGLTGELVGTGVYDANAGTTINLSRAIVPGEDGILFVNFPGDSLTNNLPNWLYWYIPAL